LFPLLVLFTLCEVFCGRRKGVEVVADMVEHTPLKLCRSAEAWMSLDAFNFFTSFLSLIFTLPLFSQGIHLSRLRRYAALNVLDLLLSREMVHFVLQRR
jgi:di/tricarboxylate transporter